MYACASVSIVGICSASGAASGAGSWRGLPFAHHVRNLGVQRASDRDTEPRPLPAQLALQMAA